MTKKDGNKGSGCSIRQYRRCLKAGIRYAVGFGTFEVKKRAARTGRNPQTGAELQIPARKVPVFKAGKGLKDLVG